MPLILDGDQLESMLGRPGVLIVDVGDEERYERHHLPGAVQLDYESLNGMSPPASGLLPSDRQLGEVLSALGLTPETHVIAYDGGKSGMAARLLWTLDVVDHRRFSLLDGGLTAWLAGGRPTVTDIARPSPTSFRVPAHTQARADKSYILDHLSDPEVVLLDARSPAEFSGQDVRAARGGHIPGAVNMNWTLAFDDARSPRLRPAEELRKLLEETGVTPDKEIIVYCQTHHRSSHSYIVLKSLGYSRVRGYDGSWSEWGNDPETPIEV